MNKEYSVDGKNIEFEVIKNLNDELTVVFEGKEIVVNKQEIKKNISVAKISNNEFLIDDGFCLVNVKKASSYGPLTESAGDHTSPMPGKIFKSLKHVGDAVNVGEGVLILEAMKMEHTVKSNQDGVVKAIHFKEGDQVEAGAELFSIESSP